MKGSGIYAAGVGICAGVAFVLLVGPNELAATALLTLAALCIVLGNRFPKLFLFGILFAAAALGVVRANILLAKETSETVSEYVDKKVDVVGEISQDPDLRETSLHATVRIISINGQKASGTLLAFLPQRMNLAYGDRVEISGKLALPQTFLGDNGNIFDYPSYLRVQGVSTVLQPAFLESEQRAGISLMGSLFNLKHAFNASLEKIFTEPDASLFEGILLGERRGLPDTLTQALVAAGLIHIVILAGYALGVVEDGVLRALNFISPRRRYFLAILLLVLFVLMTGAAVTTVRASIMASVALLARYFKRPSVALRSLVLAAIVMILFNPLILLFDASFIISTLATFGLITLAPTIEEWLRFLPEKFELRAIATSTLSVQFFSLPALLYFTGTLSFLSVPANMLALPALPWVMLWGFVAGMAGLIHPALALVPALIADIFLRWITLIVEVVHLIPYSSTTITAFPLWAAAAMYLPLFIFATVQYRKNVSREHSS